MKRQWILIGMAIIVPLLALAAGLSGLALAQGPAPQGEAGVQAALGSSFTYQGQLMYGGTSITGTCAMTFTLYDAAGGGAQVGSPIVVSGVPVTGGLFTVGLDFGSAVFAGEARWLGIRVDCPQGGAADLGRQALSAAPYALYAASTGALHERAVSSSAPSAGQVLQWNGTSWAPADAGAYWSLTGNAGTDPAANYLGTSDAVSLTLAVSGAPALRLFPNATSPNVAGGYSGNSISPTVVGATIGGGGSSGYTNIVGGNYGTIGGGRNNQANASFATVGGGGANRATANYATVGGGNANQAVTGTYATVGGGYVNLATADYATVGGGESNAASGQNATVGGGYVNLATADYAAVGGGESNAASGQNATVGGGESNAASGQNAAVGGGWINTASGNYATIPGGRFNTAGAAYAAVGGGQSNTAGAAYAAVGGGQSNQAITGTHTTVGGGKGNTASGAGATIGGGGNNTAVGDSATVGGGTANQANGDSATVPGGLSNTAGGDYSFAAGRRAQANSQGCFVWGDSTNADVACERADQFRARANGGVRFDVNGGSWAAIYDDGTDVISTSTGARLTAGGAWTNASDRALKTGVAAVDGADVLARLAQVPVSTWSYTAEDPAVRHMGPMAQDFHAAFGLGSDDRSIATVDADGVALAAIQALAAQNASQQAQIDALRRQNAALEARLAALEAAVEGGGR
jgi:hypothetical protein